MPSVLVGNRFGFTVKTDPSRSLPLSHSSDPLGESLLHSNIYRWSFLESSLVNYVEQIEWTWIEVELSTLLSLYMPTTGVWIINILDFMSAYHS